MSFDVVCPNCGAPSGPSVGVCPFCKTTLSGTTPKEDSTITTIRRLYSDGKTEQALVLAWSGAVYVFDKKVRGQPETYPLSQTPLSIILERNVNLAQRGMVTGHSYDGTATTVTAQDPRHPEYGSIQMKFTGNPVELRQWIIRDGNGNPTTVVLGGLQKANLPNSLFDVNRVN